VEHIKGKKNVVADRLSRIELPASDTDEDEEALDNMVSSVTTFPDEDDDCEDLEPRSNAVWEVSFDAASENVDDDDTTSDTNDDDTLALYNMPDLQAACPDCREIINYLCYGILRCSCKKSHFSG